MKTSSSPLIIPTKVGTRSALLHYCTIALLLGAGQAWGQHWDSPNTGRNMSILILEATLDGQHLAIEDEIAVFTPAGVLAGDCEITQNERADGDHAVGMVAWGDDPNDQLGIHFRAGEALSFKIWDQRSNREIQTEIYDVLQGRQAIYEQDSFVLLSIRGEMGEAVPTIEIDDNQMDFGSVPIGETGTITIQVGSIGGETLIIESIESDNENFIPPELEENHEIANGESEQWEFAFSPERIGIDQAVFTIRTNARNVQDGVITIDAQGRGIGPEIRLSANELEFGYVHIGYSRPRVISVSNEGDQDLVIERIQSTNAVFRFPDLENEHTISPGSSEEWTFTFAPESEGAEEAIFIIFCNAVNAGNGSIAFQAQGFGLPRTIRVPSLFETIQSAINAAIDGDTVLVEPGEYVENINFNGKNISLIGNPDNPEEVVIDGNGNGTVITFENGETNDSRILGVVIRNGQAVHGGGIAVRSSSPTIAYNIIAQNISTHDGGGIYIINDAEPVIENCEIIDNEAADEGGGLFSANSSTMVIRDCIISENRSGNIGGGIMCVSGSTLNISNSLVSDNESRAAAGGILIMSCTGVSIISNGIITGNNVTEDESGGVYVSNSNCELFRTVIANNSGRNAGGLLSRNNSQVALINSTIAMNIARTEAGGIVAGDGIIQVINSLVYDNRMSDNEVRNLTGQYSISFSDIQGGYQGDGNISSDPLFLDPDNGDFHLSVTSPCIDAGDPDSELDPDGTRADMGAFYLHQTSHYIPLRQGWNLLSSFNQPRSPAMPSVWSEVVSRENLVMIKDQSGRFYNPNIGENGFSNMQPWDVRQGYYAKVAAPDTLVIVNVPVVTGETPIPLRQGWNMAAYFPEEELDVREAFASVQDQLVLVKNDEGRFYIADRDFSNMPPLRRGKAYQVNAREDCDLIYPEGEQMRNAEFGMRNEEEPEHFQPLMTGGNMSVLLNGKWKMEDGTGEIGVFTENGLCVGAASLNYTIYNLQYTIGLAVWSDDPTTPEIDGALEGEALTFRLWDGQEERSAEFRVQNAELGQAGTSVLLFETDGFAEVVIDVGAQGLPLPTKMALYAAYPNPFNSSTLIHFDLPEAGVVSLKVTDLSGREVADLTRGLASGPYASGTHSVVWDASSQPSGIYLVKLETLQGVRSIKVTLIR